MYMVEDANLVESHQLLTVHLLGLVQGSELDILGRTSLIGEGPLNGIQIVSTDGDKGSLTGQVLVKLILKGDEGLVASRGELDIAENSTGDVWTDLCGLRTIISVVLLGIKQRTPRTSSLTIISCSWPLDGGTSLYSGRAFWPKKMLSISWIPS